MFCMDDEMAQQFERQRQLEELAEHLRSQSAPSDIRLMTQHHLCWPIFPVVPYIATMVFGLSAEELNEIYSQNVDNDC